MTDTDHTEASQVTQIPTHNYDVDGIDKFLGKVFHSKLDPDENILMFTSSTNMPGYPVADEDGLDMLERVTRPLACYFSIATAQPNERGEIRNRKNLFKRMHLVVLDDIGTKIDPADIPQALKPTFIIESSPGNFQWGFVFEEPVDDVDQASLLIKLVFSTGFTDTGGALCNKVVRLPCGINGKKRSPHGDFEVHLVHHNGPLWTPQKLLEALELSVKWEDAIKDIENTARRYLVKAQGAAIWTPAALPTAEGVIDPVAEWLYENGQVRNQTNEWLHIRCPWAHEHSAGGTDMAGYSPLGWGTGPFQVSRGFHCFHDHCSERKTQEFLQHVWQESGLNFPVMEPCYDMSSRYVYDAEGNDAWNIKDPGMRYPMPYTNMKGVEKGKVTRFTTSGSLTQVSAPAVWYDSLATVVAHGVTYAPSTPLPLTKDRHGRLRVNTYMAPDYPEHNPVMSQVQPLLDHIRWLIPDDEEHAYFLDWLTCKVKYPGFRGAGIIMVAPVEGTGRSTLGDILRELFVPSNVESIPFRELVGGGQFNAWVENLLLIVEETLAMEAGAAEWRAYDRLKEMLDPRTSSVRVNPKHGHHRISEVCTSFLMFSNHADAIKLPDGARRFYAVQNPSTVKSPGYYTALNDWKNCLNEDRTPVWASHVWNYFMRREVDVEAMTAPPKVSQAMISMREAGQSPLDIILAAMQEFYGGWVPSSIWTHLTTSAFHSTLGDVNTGVRNRVWKGKVNTRESIVVKVNGETMRVAPLRGKERSNPDPVKKIIRDNEHLQKVEAFVKEKLELAGLL
jgi:hypothetical protein